jgi:hypothetical protein
MGPCDFSLSRASNFNLIARSAAFGSDFDATITPWRTRSGQVLDRARGNFATDAVASMMVHRSITQLRGGT